MKASATSFPTLLLRRQPTAGRVAPTLFRRHVRSTASQPRDPTLPRHLPPSTSVTVRSAAAARWIAQHVETPRTSHCGLDGPGHSCRSESLHSPCDCLPGVSTIAWVRPGAESVAHQPTLPTRHHQQHTQSPPELVERQHRPAAGRSVQVVPRFAASTEKQHGGWQHQEGLCVQALQRVRARGRLRRRWQRRRRPELVLAGCRWPRNS